MNPDLLIQLSPLLVSIFLLFVGAVFGSFLNVVVQRTVKGESWVKGRSRCDDCHKQLKWFDNIPLLSYLLLRGRCRYCHHKISTSHIVLEVLTGALFVWWWWFGFFFFRLTQQPLSALQPIFWLTVGMCLLLIVVSDLKYMLIPDTAIISLTGLALIYRLVLIASGVMQPIDFGLMVMITALATIFFATIWWLTKGRGLGFGDVKLVIPLGLLLGWPRMLIGLQLAFVIGALVGVVLLATGKHKRKDPIPFGPFLILGASIALIWGYQLSDWYFGLMGLR